MVTPFLLDVNVLIAVVYPNDTSHHRVRSWFEETGRHHWATCPLTEAGFVRILCNPRFAGGEFDTNEGLAMLSALTQLSNHQFWPLDLPFAEVAKRFPGRLHGHQQVTDAYLLSLAMNRKGKLVTLDRSIRALTGAKYRASSRAVSLSSLSYQHPLCPLRTSPKLVQILSLAAFPALPPTAFAQLVPPVRLWRACGLSRPYLHALEIARLLRFCPHGRRKAALYRIGSRCRRIRSCSGTDVVSLEAASGAAAEDAARHRVFGSGYRKRLRPRRMNLCLWTHPERGSRLRCAGSQHECRSDSALISNVTGGDNRHLDSIDDGRNQCEEAHEASLGFGSLEAASMSGRPPSLARQ